MPSQGNRKIVFIIQYPLDSAPGQRFRFEQYFSLLRENQFKISIHPFLSERTYRILYLPGNYSKKILGVLGGLIRRIGSLMAVSSADYVFLYREATPLGPPVFEWVMIFLLRKRIIYDFDDSIWLTDQQHEDLFTKAMKCRSKVAFLCRQSYRVSCGNAYLSKYARLYNRNVILNPTTIDTNRHNPNRYPNQKNDDVVTIGWTGTHSTLPYLALIYPVMKAIEEKYSHVRFLIIADRTPSFHLASMLFVPWNKSSEISDLMRIDIGIMPLPQDLWAQGKCGLKILQFLALEIPTVASPIGVNKDVIEAGENGFLAMNHQEWIDHLSFLVNNEGARLKMGKAGRETVLKRYSVDSNSSNFLSLFD